jgi:hypothetical protein
VPLFVTIPLALVGWITISVSGLVELNCSSGLDGLELVVVSKAHINC